MPNKPVHMRSCSVRKLMGRLRKHAPLKVPIRIVQQLDPRNDGKLVLGYLASRYRRSRPGRPINFRIVVERRLPAGEKFDVIVHEWAHALDRERRRFAKDRHDTRWGQCYSMAFKASRQ